MSYPKVNGFNSSVLHLQPQQQCDPDHITPFHGNGQGGLIQLFVPLCSEYL